MVHLYESGAFVEWLREKPFKLAALKQIAQAILAQQTTTMTASTRHGASLSSTKSSSKEPCARYPSISSVSSSREEPIGILSLAEVSPASRREPARAPPPLEQSATEASQIGIRRRLRVADEVHLPIRAGATLHLYLSEQFKSLPPGSPPGGSLYDQVSRNAQ